MPYDFQNAIAFFAKFQSIRTIDVNSITVGATVAFCKYRIVLLNFALSLALGINSSNGWRIIGCQGWVQICFSIEGIFERKHDRTLAHSWLAFESVAAVVATVGRAIGFCEIFDTGGSFCRWRDRLSGHFGINDVTKLGF